jgi:hypothetical protein
MRQAAARLAAAAAAAAGKESSESEEPRLNSWPALATPAAGGRSLEEILALLSSQVASLDARLGPTPADAAVPAPPSSLREVDDSLQRIRDTLDGLGSPRQVMQTAGAPPPDPVASLSAAELEADPGGTQQEARHTRVDA